MHAFLLHQFDSQEQPLTLSDRQNKGRVLFALNVANAFTIYYHHFRVSSPPLFYPFIDYFIVLTWSPD